MARCSAIKLDGTPCERIVPEHTELCFSHDPERAAERAKNAATAGRSRGPGVEVAEIKAELRRVAGEVLEGETSTARGSVFATLYGVLLRAIEAERRARETEQLERRLEALENSREANRWHR